jgi:hypothetical protein
LTAWRLLGAGAAGCVWYRQCLKKTGLARHDFALTGAFAIPNRRLRQPRLGLLRSRLPSAAAARTGGCLDRGSLSPESKLFCRRRAAFRIGRCCQRVIRRKPPADAISRRFEAVYDPQMPAQGYCAKSAFEAYDMVGLHRSPDRHCRRQFLRRQGGRCRIRAESAQCLMHRRNQSPELVNSNAVFANITADDLGNQVRIDVLRTAVFSHISCPITILLVGVYVRLIFSVFTISKW